MIETLKKKLQENNQSHPVYMAYMLLDQETKYKIVMHEIDRSLPSIVNCYTISLNKFIRKKNEASMLKRQMTWRSSMESVGEWDEKELSALK